MEKKRERKKKRKREIFLSFFLTFSLKSQKKKLPPQHSLEYARPARLALWLAAEVAIVGADVQEVVGSALALTLLSKGALSLPAAIVASAASSFALLYVERLGVRHLEALFALFIGTMVRGERERARLVFSFSLRAAAEEKKRKKQKNSALSRFRSPLLSLFKKK